MAVINLLNNRTNVDIEAELRQYEWSSSRWTPDKLIASSPFRDDNAPSFYVSLEGEYAGVWGDSGAAEDRYASGGFVTLIEYLRRTSYEEAAEYLLSKYGEDYVRKPNEPIHINAPRLREVKINTEMTVNPVTEAVSPYMLTRGIDEDVQKLFAIGYGENYKGFTAMPWHTPDGRLANVKYRSTKDKRFFYEKDATPVKTLVYGLDVVIEGGHDYAVLNEGEIDALSWWSVGIPAIAIGGSHASDEQLDAIRRSGVTKLYLGADNDKQGEKLNRQVTKDCGGSIELFGIDYGVEKDANDVLLRQSSGSLRSIIEGSKPVRKIHVQLKKR